MDKKRVTGLGLALAAAILFFTNLFNVVLTFLLAGVIPGTHIVVPYWFMMAVYCVLITIIATPYLERLVKFIYDKRLAAKQSPRSTHRRTLLSSISLR